MVTVSPSLTLDGAVYSIKGDGLPEQMADINSILNALSPGAREKILTAFVNDLFVQ